MNNSNYIACCRVEFTVLQAVIKYTFVRVGEISWRQKMFNSSWLYGVIRH